MRPPIGAVLASTGKSATATFSLSAARGRSLASATVTASIWLPERPSRTASVSVHAFRPVFLRVPDTMASTPICLDTFAQPASLRRDTFFLLAVLRNAVGLATVFSRFTTSSTVTCT